MARRRPVDGPDGVDDGAGGRDGSQRPAQIGGDGARGQDGRDRVRLALDPFTGLGSTALACARLGIEFIGIELDRVYLDEAVARTRAALAAPPLP